MDPLLVKPNEAAKVLAIGRSSLYRLLAEGELPSIKLGRATLIPVSALQGWIARRAADSHAQEVD